jgi:hypothetical protein
MRTTDVVTMRMQAAELYGKLHTRNVSMPASAEQRRVCRAMWHAKARWYRRSAMHDSARVCLETAARVSA